MSDYGFDETLLTESKSRFERIPPYIVAPLLIALPFTIVDFFNYYSVGTALALSLPILTILYAGCGALAGYIASKRENTSGNFLLNGAVAALTLWLLSTVINTIISLIIGTATLGTTLLLGIPYLCLCAPFQMVGGGLIGALGGFLYGLFHKGESGNEDYYG